MTVSSSPKTPVAPDHRAAPPSSVPPKAQRPAAEERARARPAQPAVPEIGGPQGPEPTRYGDWEKGGRCTDF